jgi:hypothetical protein
MARMSNPNMQLLYADLERRIPPKLLPNRNSKNSLSIAADGKQIYVAESEGWWVAA